MTAPIRERIEGAGRRAFGAGWSATRVASAPGRIELIGNHLDYNGGPVLAAAVDRRIWAASRETGSLGIRATFADMPERSGEPVVAMAGTAPEPMREGVHPVNYLIGAIEALRARDIALIEGLEIVVAGNLPHGVGISSSAALCVNLVATLARDPAAVDNLLLVELAREAENRTGSPCGAMDQSASIFGDVIRFDGADGSVQTLRPDLGEHAYLLADSNVVRSLATSSYPVRVRESAEALRLLREAVWPDLGSLAEVPVSALPDAEEVLEKSGNPALARRVRHIATETDRVYAAQDALDSGDWVRFGRLMTGSGRSSAGDYEISHPDVEELVGCCLEHPGVLGARMMGGGEGGSVLALFRRSDESSIVAHLDTTYYGSRPGRGAGDSVRACSIGSGLSVADGWS